MTALAPCSSCARHVRRTERACPFCGSAIVLPDAPAPRVIGERLGRAALFTVGAAIVTTTTACAAPVYGGPPHDAAAGNDANVSAADAGTDGGGGTLYGAPPEDAAVDIDTGGSSSDYGAPPAP